MIWHATAWSLLLAMVALGPALAEDQFMMLDGKQIKARVVGLDITDGPH
ncbi:hypothetical protein ACRQ5Q_42690 (plasmid) [Bradyrhizobium sp. PMVTL-01]